MVQHDQTWHKQIEVVAMAGFTEFKSAAGEEPSKALAIMVPFHVVALAGDRSTSATTQVAWGAYQRLIQAYHVMGPGRGRDLMQQLISSQAGHPRRGGEVDRAPRS
ncbi:hypothetical protein BKH36_11700 [Actinomyces naeslundii]|nr:hypothetical protein BKH36_11700 [Actinomyces naeslundii]